MKKVLLIIISVCAAYCSHPVSPSLLAQQRDEALRIEAHDGTVLAVAFTPDGRQLLSAGTDGTIRVSDASTGRKIKALKTRPELQDVTFSTDGILAACTSYHSVGPNGSAAYVEVFNIDKESVVAGKNGQTICYAVFTPDGKHVICGDSGGILTRRGVTFGGADCQIMDVASKETRSISIEEDVPPPIAISPDGELFVSPRNNVPVLAHALTGKKVRDCQELSDAMTCAQFSRDGKRVLVGSAAADLCLIDTATGRRLRSFTGHTGRVFGVTFSRDGLMAISCEAGVKKKEGDFKHPLISSFLANETNRSKTMYTDYDKAYGYKVIVWDVLGGKKICHFQGASGPDLLFCIFPRRPFGSVRRCRRVCSPLENCRQLILAKLKTYERPSTVPGPSVNSDGLKPTDGKERQSPGGLSLYRMLGCVHGDAPRMVLVATAPASFPIPTQTRPVPHRCTSCPCWAPSFALPCTGPATSRATIRSPNPGVNRCRRDLFPRHLQVVELMRSRAALTRRDSLDVRSGCPLHSNGTEARC